jgi:hypothetical protein
MTQNEIGYGCNSRPDSFQPYFGLNRHSRSKQLVAIFPILQADAHGQPLNHFTKLPVAFSGGSRLVRVPVAPGMLCTYP